MRMLINCEIEKPEGCYACLACDESAEYCYFQPGKSFDTFESYKGMQENCPLVEVPDDIADAMMLVIAFRNSGNRDKEEISSLSDRLVGLLTGGKAQK